MAEIILPTDSVLRRHFEQQATTRGLGAPPEDSILRRHYTQLLTAAPGKVSVSTPTKSPAPAQAHRSAVSEPTAAPVTPQASAAPQTPEKPKGWFARLFGKMFGG